MKRRTSQNLIPVTKESHYDSSYDIYPSFPVENGAIKKGYTTLAEELTGEETVILDGYVGVDWDEVTTSLQGVFDKKGLRTSFQSIKTFLKPEDDILSLITPFLGGDDPIFGFRTPVEIGDYFVSEKMGHFKLDSEANVNILYGTGASTLGIEGKLVYFDLPKNELQFRMRANAIANFGFSSPKAHKQMYKHFYFVDWPILNREKKRLLPNISIIVDQQRPGNPVWMSGDALRDGLERMSQSYFRVRPWFEPGVWGGQWMKERFKELNPDVPNYAWSFEMIVPENGLLFESDGKLLEVSFDMLMFQNSANILGKAEKRFGDEFPIRFDFLDTFDGGNLSVQCHPKPDYIKKEFGENFTQDETYYILDAEKDAEVYLGFQEGINKTDFHNALQHSYKTKEELDVEKYVQKFPAKKHDLFLIPHGTIHCSGSNNMVLEISATPYIFTFKMYDWQRLDLDGNPRPMNIERAFENLNFQRQGNTVPETLIAQPKIEKSGDGWEKIHLPTHQDHFYEIYRYEFDNEMSVETNDQCHVLMLVEGQSIDLKVEGNKPRTFHYAETFAVPAAANKYRLVNKGAEKAKVVVSFVKDEAC
jgi:mannose-6-phosphate isomerase class I